MLVAISPASGGMGMSNLLTYAWYMWPCFIHKRRHSLV